MSAKATAEIWDRSKTKIVLYVMDARDLSAAKKETANTYVVVKSGDVVVGETAVAKRTLTPVWEELFFVERGEAITFSVMHKKGVGADMFLGTARIQNPELLPYESVEEKLLPLGERDGGKNKKNDKSGGHLRIRIYVSLEPETPPPHLVDYAFSYDALSTRFKTGDLIMYNEYGVLAALNKVLSNSSFSRAGMIVELPNRYTGKYELFVVELTRNTEKLIDAFDDHQTSGLRVFRLFDRIHNIYAHEIHYVSLLQPLDCDSGEALVRYVEAARALQEEEEPKFKPREDPGPVRRFMKERFQLTEKKTDMIDLTSAEFMVAALNAAGLLRDYDNSKDWFPFQLPNKPCFQRPELVRTRALPPAPASAAARSATLSSRSPAAPGSARATSPTVSGTSTPSSPKSGHFRPGVAHESVATPFVFQ